jgi:ribosomal protein S18 acetylase RimI-like enzyme
VATPLHGARITRRVWLTEEAAFVAGARWTPVGEAQAIVHPELPEVWDASFIGRVPPDADPRRLLEVARHHLSKQGCGHVKILLDDAACFPTVGSSLGRLGMLRRAYATMLTRRLPPDPEPRGRFRIQRIRSAEDRAVMAEVRDAVRRQAPWYAPEVSRALDAWEDLQASTLDLVWLVGYLDEEPAGAVGLLLTDDGASLQSLATVPALRRRGVASALVHAVVSEGLARGAPFVSLLTDRDDMPRRLYRGLGFEDVGEVHEYLKAIG